MDNANDILVTLMNKVDSQAISAAIAACFTAVIGFSRWYLRKRLPGRRMFRFAPKSNLLIVASSSGSVRTRSYRRSTTGIGQVRGMLILNPYLISAYHQIDVERLRLSGDTLGRELEGNLLVLGGPKTNSVTGVLLKQLAPCLPFGVTDVTITWDGIPYCGSDGDGEILNDYGYIVRAVNPFNPRTRIVIVGGSHTYGVVAAARWLSGEGSSRKLPKNIAVLVEADVVREGHVTAPRLVHLTRLQL